MFGLCQRTLGIELKIVIHKAYDAAIGQASHLFQEHLLCCPSPVLKMKFFTPSTQTTAGLVDCRFVMLGLFADRIATIHAHQGVVRRDCFRLAQFNPGTRENGLPPTLPRLALMNMTSQFVAIPETFIRRRRL